MRILFITDGFPYPLTSGYLRHYHLIRSLCDKHEITMLSAVDASFRPEHLVAMEPYTAHVQTFLSTASRSRSPVRRGIKWIRTLTGVNPTLLQMRRALIRLLAEKRFDILLLSGEYTYHVVRGLEIPLLVSDMCDAYSLRTRGRMKHASRVGLLTLWVKYFHLKRLEQQVIGKAMRVLFASDRDAVIVPAASHEKIVIVPNGVDTDYWQRQSASLGHHTIVFTGAMHYPPNEDAALYLLRDIAPVVRRSIPDLRVLIVGHSPSVQLVEAARAEPGVTVTGFVDDMRPYLEQATVFVAPLRFGSGIQNKVLEALAMKLPVVTTPVAAEGLSTLSGEVPPVLVAGNTEEFARSVVQQLLKRTQDPTPWTEGRAFVESNFVWASSASRLEQVLEGTREWP